MVIYPKWVGERGFGGANVADSPVVRGESTHWPVGKCASGALECCELLIDACNAGNGDQQTMVFLVGGAGNGKSFLANKVSNDINGKLLGEHGIFARRLYSYELENGKILDVVNDATMPPDDDNEEVKDFLVRDLARNLAHKGNFLACVNRGIFISEVNNFQKDRAESEYIVATNVVRWLLEGSDKNLDLPEGWSFSTVPENTATHYSYGVVTSDDSRSIHIHVSFMDQTSLFEPMPELAEQPSGAGAALKFKEHKLIPLSQDFGEIEYNSPSFDVLETFSARVRETFESENEIISSIDPVYANISNFNNPQFLVGLSNVLRAAEIHSGSHVTYRDMWGVTELSLMGPIGGRSYEDLGREIQELIQGAESGDIAASATCMIRLACLRAHMSIFSARLPEFLASGTVGQPTYPSQPVLKSLTSADPLKALENSVGSRIKQKLLLLNEGVSPGSQLAAEDKAFGEVWSDFDESLERKILSWLAIDDKGLEFSKRNQLLSWYGQYLSRLCSVVHGMPAHADKVGMWQKLWNQASKGSSRPRGWLKDGLDNLVFASFDTSNPVTMLPVFSSKVVPVTKNRASQHIVLEIQKGRYEWTIFTEGDVIYAELNNLQFPGKGAKLVLDFPMFREIYAMSESDGFTEVSLDVEPRIERVRAKILSLEEMNDNVSGANYVFVDNGTLIE